MEIGIDIGGTFTDAVVRDGQGAFLLLKVPSTPDDPARAVGEALAQLVGGQAAAGVQRFLHGTTVATNAILENTAALVGLITTRGFADVIEIGRTTRASNYDLVFGPQTPGSVVPVGRRFGVGGRIGADGAVVDALDEAGVTEAVAGMRAAGVEAVAICLLFSFLNPAHERRAREIVKDAWPGVAVSLSCEVDPALREYERTCATVFDAALKPVMAAYLERIEGILEARGITAPLQVMHSRGGLLGAAAARGRPIRLTLSGPSAAAIGAASVLRAAGFMEGVSIDVGGTSADVALIEGGVPRLRADGVIGTFPVRVPTADVLAIGAGGGSIAWIDGAGGLQVGPRSAGAVPGPACYGRGGMRATLLDASVVLGLVDPERFAGGAMRLDAGAAREAAWGAIEREVAGPLGLGVREAAVAMHRVANAALAEAVRRMTVARGTDPRELALLPAGGGGGLHGAAIADELGMGTIVVPGAPGVLAAMGLLEAPLEHDAAQGFYRTLDTLPEAVLRESVALLVGRCAEAMAADGVAPGEAETEVTAFASFVGQGHNLAVRIGADAGEPGAAIRVGFIAAHLQAYGHTRDAPVRLVELRAVQRARTAGVATIGGQPGGAVHSSERVAPGRRLAVIDGVAEEVAVVQRGALGAGQTLEGPAILEQADSTLVIPRSWRVTAQAAYLLMQRMAA